MDDLDNHPVERIRWIIDRFYAGHPKRLADKLGMAPATFSQILNKGAFPSWKVITGILRIHSEVNPDWFLHGVLPRLKDPNSQLYKLQDMNSRLRALVEKLVDELKT